MLFFCNWTKVINIYQSFSLNLPGTTSFVTGGCGGFSCGAFSFPALDLLIFVLRFY